MTKKRWQVGSLRPLSCGGLLAACFPMLACADFVTLHPVADTTLFSTYPDNNLGASTQLVAGSNASSQPRRALIRFDPTSQIPANAKIQSVALTMRVMTEPPNGGIASVFDLHRLLVDWGEGTGTSKSGIQAKNGEATWNARFYPATLWSQAGAAVSSDYSASVSASLFVGGLANYTFNSTSGLVADVQQWLNSPASNFGWILLSESEGTAYTVRRFASREDLQNSPTLQVQYLIPSPPKILGINASANSVEITFQAVASQSYTVEYRNSLNSGTWSTLTNLPPQNVTTNLIVTDPILARPHRCYRLGTSF